MYSALGRNESRYIIIGLQPATEYYFSISIVLADNTVGYNTIASFERSTLDGCKNRLITINSLCKTLD